MNCCGTCFLMGVENKLRMFCNKLGSGDKLGITLYYLYLHQIFLLVYINYILQGQ